MIRPARRFAVVSALLAAAVVLAAACGEPSPTASPELASPLPIGPTPATEEGPALDLGQDLTFEHISVEHGLSQGTVSCILQDSLGFMWFCTQEGLNRYDGYGFKVYKHDPQNPNSLSHNEVTALAEDREGNLWIATYGGGLDRYNRRAEIFTHYRHDPGNVNSLVDDRLTSLLVDGQGLWIGTEAGLDGFEPQAERFTHYLPEPGSSQGLSGWTIESLYQDSEGLLWIGTSSDGLNRLDPATGDLVHVPLGPGEPDDPSDKAPQRAIVEDLHGHLWIGTTDGLVQLDRQTGEVARNQHQPDNPHSLGNNMVSSILEDSAGALWIGTYGGGLDRLDPATGRFAHYRSLPNDPSSLSSNAVLSIYQDRVGVLWIGTAGAGISKRDPDTKRFARYGNDPANANSLGNNTVWAILEDGAGLLWIGMLGGGLDRFDRESGEWRHYRNVPGDPHSLSSNSVTSICEDREGGLWIGTLGGGLDRLDRVTERFTHYPIDPGDARSLGTPVVHALLLGQDGVVWIATDDGPTGGLHRFDPKTERFDHYPPDPNDPQTMGAAGIQVLYEDRSGALWLGTSGTGLNRLDPATSRFERYQNHPGDPGSLSNNKVTAIYEDQEGVLWVGTDGGGLNRFNRDRKTFVHYTVEDGLPGNAIYGILEEDTAPPGGPGGRQGVLWLSTNNGLSKFDPGAEIFQSYDARDGLQDNVFNMRAHFKSSSGEMFFGGTNGFNAFYPAQIVDNATVPPIVLTSLTQLTRYGEDVTLGTSVESARQIVFRWPNNAFEFEFAALNLVQADKNQHAYLLEGFDKDWNHVGTRRYGRYTNLPAGTYSLHMIGSNNDGVWNREGARVTITVVPPVWQTWWFWGIVLLGLAAALFAAYRWRVRTIEARSRALEQQVIERTAELRQEIDQRLQVEERLRQSEMEAAVAAERSRLARELHDAVTQTLFSASLIAEALPVLWERDQEKGRERLGTLRQMSRGALAEMRTLLLELRPAALVETSLEDLLRQLGEAVTGGEGVPVAVTVEGKCRLPADVHVALYRITQEALNNVARHAKASQAVVSLHCIPRTPSPASPEGAESQVRVELCIRDDGRGFDPDDVPPDHLGLGIMRERAEAVGAQLEITSQAGQGATVVVVWPGDEG